MSIKQVKIDSNINQLKEVSNQINNNINNEINNVETNVDFIDLDIFKKKKEKKKEINNIPKNINNEINNAKKIEKVQGKYQEKTIYYDENGEKIAEFFEETHLLIYYQEMGEGLAPKHCYYRYNPDTKEIKNISIFDEENIRTLQYGAKQENFKNYMLLMHNNEIVEEMERYYPRSAFETDDDYWYFIGRYFNIIAETGCGYSASINTIFKEYEGKEDEFRDIFGFDMYDTDNVTGKINFNYELMFLKYFNYCNAGKYTLKEMGDSAGVSIKDDYKEPASLTSANIKNFDDFLKKEFGVKCKIKKCKIPDSVDKNDEGINNYLHQQFDENDYIEYCGTGWELYTMDGKLDDGRGTGHSLTIVGFTDDNYPIVSSWGKKYVLHIKSDGEESDYRIYKINYND